MEVSVGTELDPICWLQQKLPQGVDKGKLLLQILCTNVHMPKN